jgi:hypothetical protein
MVWSVASLASGIGCFAGLSRKNNSQRSGIRRGPRRMTFSHADYGKGGCVAFQKLMLFASKR